ncbi:MAG: acyltransferase [Rhodocyclaceae bacterium]|nr:acyltransferase [Rhodocyclaceae bacterium]
MVLPRGHVPALTGLRGVAALWVALYHLWQFHGQPRLAAGAIDFTPVVACGYFGVDLFFVLSGYLLGRPFVAASLTDAPRPSLRRFWAHRARRVLPAYLGQLVLLTTAGWYLGGRPHLGTAELVSHALLVFNLYDNGSRLNPVYWSLPVEWNFYMVLPLLAAAFPRSRRATPWILPVLALFCIAFRLSCWLALDRWGADGVAYYRLVLQLPARIDEFAFGVAAAWYVAAAGTGRDRLRQGLGLSALAAMCWQVAPKGDFLVTAEMPWLLFHFTLLGAVLALILSSIQRLPRGMLARLLSMPPMVWLGTVSYSLYLWHFPLIEAIRGLARGHHLPLPLSAAAGLLASLAAASVSYRLLERPFLPASDPARAHRPTHGRIGRS